MCGIVLMMSNEGTKGAAARRNAFTQGVIIDTMRGPHSTGLAYVDKDGFAETYKKPIPGHDFVETRKFGSIIKDIDDYPIMIAHNRWATKGKVNTVNSHPFSHGTITGVHNGSLWTWKNLSPNDDFETDSEYIFKALADATDTSEVIPYIDGAFVLVWHDSDDNTLHVCRNDDRPFHIAYIKDEDTIIATSEFEMLEFMMHRNGFESDDIFQAKSGHEFIFSMDDLKNPTSIEHELYDDYRYANYNSWTRPLTNTVANSNINKPMIPYSKSKRVGKVVRGNSMEFIRYSAQGDHGYILAMSIEDPYDFVRVQGFTVSEYNAIKEECLQGKVVAESIDYDNNGYLSISKNDVTFIDEVRAYKGMDYDEGKLNRASDGTILNWSRFDDDDDSDLGATGDDDEKKLVTSEVDDGVTTEEVAEEAPEKKLEAGKTNIIILPTSHASESAEEEEEASFYTKEGVIITTLEAEKLVKHGCGACGDPIQLEDFNEVEWHYQDTPICVACCDTIYCD